MFNFMKKGVGVGERGGEKSDRDEKEKRKRDKKMRKEAAKGVSGSMSTEELLRLDEVRRSLKIRGRRKEKEKLPSGITADYSEFFAHLDVDRSEMGGGIEMDRGTEEIMATASTTMADHQNGSSNGGPYMSSGSAGGGSGSLSSYPVSPSNTYFGVGLHGSHVLGPSASISHSDSSETSLHSGNNSKPRYLPPVPPKPPKRGILKGSRSSIANINEEVIISPDSKVVLLRNTLQNELLFEEAQQQQNQQFTSVESLRSDGGGDFTPILNMSAANSPHLNNLHVMTSPSPSAESLTDTTNSSFATPPFSLSPIGESQGIYRWSRVHAFDDVDLPMPPIRLVKLPPPREFAIKRQKSPRNDFGFSLRKAICLDRTGSLLAPSFKPVIFAEPGAGGGATGLLPGDRLLKVNGTPVGDLPRETIIEMIRNSGDSVTVEVQPVAELVELSRRCMVGAEAEETDRSAINANCNTLKRSASRRFRQEARPSDSDDSDVPTGESVWLVHRGGFTGALRLPGKATENGKVTIQLLHNGEQLNVDEDDIEKANTPNLDLVEDICQLKHLNEASVLHCLRQRYASNLIHTKAGPILIVVNPMAPLSLYSEKVVSMFRGCKTEDMPPHVYSLAQTAYRTMLETRRDQSLIFMGRSGSGKTTSFKHALYYLALAAGSANKLLTAEKVNAINTILEAFGNTRTCLNANATRFTQILSLDFDHTGQIGSASVQLLLLERSRAGKRTNNESTFHILTRLLAGAEGLLQKELHLENISSEDTNPFISLSQKLEDRHKAASEFSRTVQAFDTLNVDSSAVKGIWNILASIYHLGVAGVSKIGTGPTSRIQFGNPSAARKAATLLGVSLEDLLLAAFPSNSPGGSSPARSPTETPESAWESLEGLVIGLYSEAVAAAVALINKAICTPAHTFASILLVDTPGFQNPASCGVQIGANLSDLKHNYLQERLQLLFHHMTLVAPKDRYAQELVEIETEGLTDTHPGPLVSLIDKAPQSHVVRTSQRDLREQDRRGLLWLLDEESMYPNSNDDTFLERLFSHYSDREHHALIRRAVGTRHFILQHLQGTNPVLYSSQGWLKASREHPAIKNAGTLLQDSTKDEINRLYVGNLTRGAGVVFYGSIAGLEGSQSLRRVSSIRRSFTSAGVKRNSVMLQLKFTVDGVIDTLRRTGTHFVHCYLLQHNGGTHSIVNGSPTQSINESDEMVNVPLLRSQLRGSQVLEAARLHKLGFPEPVPLSEFVRRFGLLGDASNKNLTVEQILSANEIDSSLYRIGPSQVLFRSGVLNQLEAKRDELLSDRIIQLQSYCRGYLARRRVAQRRVQELAVRCIQRNVKAFLAVRDWPWWRLLVRVTPLLNVHRTEEQLKVANDELQALRAKLEKFENERNSLKTENDKLEAKLSEMTVDLAEERSAANITSERLEAETAERLKLEKELQENQLKVKNLQEVSEKLEMELICARSDLNGISEDEDPDNEDSGGVYKLKYERVARELEFTKRRLQTQHEHDLEQLVGLKKQLEKKLADAYEEVEEQRQVVGQWKRKAQKMTNEMNDLRMLLEEQNSRNNLLEKKQRKFDSECQSLQDAARQERQAKDRLAREKDMLIAEKFTLEQNLADTRLELELKDEKLTALQRELDEMTTGGGTEEEFAQLRRSKIDLERRFKEQEEELDEMAGQVQLLEQAKLRLEMSLETMRKEAKREAQQRDDELEEARGNSYKKIKALECQLETEHEERTLLLREKHELERRLQSAEDQDRVDRAAEEVANQKLRRDLRKYKALLKDAHAQLERAKAESPGKALIRQLRNQLEDAEAARSIAMKARQSAEGELAETQASYEEAQRARQEAEDRAVVALRDRSELQAQIEENEEEMAELMKKYSATVKQLNNEHSAMSEYEIRISELEAERNSLKEQVSELQSRLENIENHTDPSAVVHSKRLELRAKELESRLELEQATRARLEIQANRHKDGLEKIQSELAQSKVREMQSQDAFKKSQKNLRELREELHSISNREQESLTRRKDLEKRLETAEAESTSLRNDLRLALQRIADLQQAMEEGDDEDVTESDESESTEASISDLEQRLKPIQTKRMLSVSMKKDTANGISDTTLVIRERKSDNSPRITVTSPSTPSVPDMSLKNGDASYA